VQIVVRCLGPGRLRAGAGFARAGPGRHRRPDDDGPDAVGRLVLSVAASAFASAATAAAAAASGWFF